MTLIRPFRALRPVPTRAREVIAPPYDVLSSAEARARAKGKPWSFLHVSKAEIDLPEGTDPYAPAVYATAAENLKRMRSEGVLMRDANPNYYAYRATWTGRPADGACLRRLARRLRHQPHPQARAHDAGEGDRSRQADRGAQRPDRPCHDGLSACARDRPGLEARHRSRPRRRRHGRRRRQPRAVGDRRSGRDRPVHGALRGAARASTSATATTAPRRPRAWRKRAAAAPRGRTAISSA